jgi:hypothetical protein
MSPLVIFFTPYAFKYTHKQSRESSVSIVNRFHALDVQGSVPDRSIDSSVRYRVQTRSVSHLDPQHDINKITKTTPTKK